MKHILNDLSEQEKNFIREQHTGGMKVMTEGFSKLINSKLGDVKPLVNEQRLPFLSVFPNKNILSKSGIEGQNGGNIIYLTKRDPKTGKVVPGSKFSYKIGGKYMGVPFDIVMQKVERGLSSGSLYAEVKPKNNTVYNVVKKLLPKENDKGKGQTFLKNDGWIQVMVMGNDLNDALGKLFDNKGEQAKIDIPNSGGISITLEQV
jgi:hypothetical protein